MFGGYASDISLTIMDNQMEASTLSLSKLKIVHEKISWPGGPSMKQYFSLPSSIIYYMTNNPSSPEVYNKLIQSCKYFFEKNAIISAKRIHHAGRKICATDDIICMGATEKCCVNLNIAAPSKLWITEFADFSGELINFTSLSQKMYRCDFTELALHNQHLYYDEFKFLTSSVKNICLGNIKIFYNDGSTVTFDKILEALPNIVQFRYWFGNMPKEFVSPSNNFPMNLEHLELIVLLDTPEVFNVNEFYALIQNYETTKVLLEFVQDISDEYKLELDGLITAVIESEIPNRLIEYPGQDEEKLKILDQRLER